MKTRIEIDPQVAVFIRALAPQPRTRLRDALHRLEQERGDIRELEGRLSGYARLRVGSYRVIFRRYMDRGHAVIRCVFAKRRAVVYELFTELLFG